MNRCDLFPKTQDYLENELSQRRADVRRLQEEITALRQVVTDLHSKIQNERCDFKMSKRKLEDTIRCNEAERSKILFEQEQIINKVHGLEKTIECLNQSVNEMVQEKNTWQSKYTNLKSLTKSIDQSRQQLECLLDECDHQLREANEKIKQLEEEKKNAINEIHSANNDVECLEEKVSYIMEEREKLKEILNCKGDEIKKLQNESNKKYCTINKLEEKLSRMNCELVRSQNEEKRAQKDICSLKGELQQNLDDKRKLSVENKRLNCIIESLNTDLEQKNEEMHNTSMEKIKINEMFEQFSEKLKLMKQQLDEKNKIGEDFLHQISTLESINCKQKTLIQQLEADKNCLNTNLLSAFEKINNLRFALKSKVSLVNDLEEQIKELSHCNRSLKTEVCELQKENMVLTSETETKKEIICSLEMQNRHLESNLCKMGVKVEQVTNEISRSQVIIKELTSQLECQKRTVTCLESVISDNIQEAREESLQNFVVNQKVQELHTSVDKLQEKLTRVNDVLSNCQSACNEYSAQNNDLNFQMVNEKYARALGAEWNHMKTCNPCGKYPSELNSHNPFDDNKLDGARKESTKTHYDKDPLSLPISNSEEDSSTAPNTAVQKQNVNIAENIFVTNKYSKNDDLLSTSPPHQSTTPDKASVCDNINYSSESIRDKGPPISSDRQRIQVASICTNPSDSNLPEGESSNSPEQFLSIVEEGPIYKVKKKKYKKVKE